MLSKSFFMLIAFLLIFSMFFIQPASASSLYPNLYEHSFKITDIKAYENSSFYTVDIFFEHYYLSPSPFNDDSWDIMIAWSWGPYADLENLIGYDSASAYLTQRCLSWHPNTIDEARTRCSFVDATTTNARLSPIGNSGCPSGYPNCCFADSAPHSYLSSAGGYVLMDDIPSNRFTDSNSGDILLEIRFSKSNIDWNEFKSKVLNGIYVIMDWDTPGATNDDVANFIWSPDSDHVDHNWYFERVLNSAGSIVGCAPHGTEGEASSLHRLADSMDDSTGGGWHGTCNDWKFMGSSHEEFYGGVAYGFGLRSIGAYSDVCDPHIAKPVPDGGGSSTCIDQDCNGGNTAGVAWASEEKKLGRDVGMQCDNNTNFYQCYSGNCDLTDQTCIKCSGAIQIEGKTGTNACEAACGASQQCDEKSSGSWCSGDTAMNCNSNCQFSQINCKIYGSNYYCSSGTCQCSPTTCSALGYNCGTWSNGCGGTLNCGTCASGQTCSSGHCASSGGGGGGGGCHCYMIAIGPYVLNLDITYTLSAVSAILALIEITVVFLIINKLKHPKKRKR